MSIPGIKPRPYHMSNLLERLQQRVPPATLYLILINIVIWLVQRLLEVRGIDLVNLFGLHYPIFPGHFHIWQPITYAFLHATSGIGHLFFNMFSLFFFGRVIEQTWGTRRFLVYYLFCAFTAAATQVGVWALAIPPQALPHVATIGASGAVFGLLLAFGMLYPNERIYLIIPPIPFKAKYFVIFYGIIELFFGVTGLQSSVAHFAHLGGMIGGLILILLWRKKGRIHGPYH